jgi:hypothetical protein
MGVKLKLSSAYHPETDGSSKCSNKTINQYIHYHVTHNQKGWVCALPHIQFHIMNSLNASTGFLNFQLCLGHSPQCTDTAEARDNFLLAKKFQTHHANLHRLSEPPFKIGNKVMLSTTAKNSKRRANGRWLSFSLGLMDHIL